MSNLEKRIQTLFGGASLVSDGASPFYAKGAPIDNPFYPFYNRETNEIVLLTPDAQPSTMQLLKKSLQEALSQVFMGKVPLTSVQKWSTHVYSPHYQTMIPFLGTSPKELSQPGMVYLGVAGLPGSMSSHKKSIDIVLALAHASTALSLIGCSPSVERTA
mgnify:CR=1 FL=1